VTFGRTRNLAIGAALLAVCAVAAGDPPLIPDLPDSNPPGRLHDDVMQKAEPLAQPPSQRVFDQHLQTINWLQRPKDTAANPLVKPLDDSTVRPAAAQVPIEPSPTVEPAEPPHDWFHYTIAPGTQVEVGGLFRGYYRNDQRIAWSGVEETFGAEGVLRPTIQSQSGGWTVSAQGEFFINQPYGSSILSDPQRDLYKANFQIEPFEVFQLFGQAQYGDWLVRVGKTRTPFGNYPGPTFTNSLIDAPFIRTEVIDWTETGIFVRWQPGPWSFDLAITNGEPDLDTNSSKAAIGRAGYNGSCWTVGASFKYQDGVSSEQQKQFNNVYGYDASVHFGHVVIYTEGTYDEYGFRHANYVLADPMALGVRSLYDRQVFSGKENVPVHGFGYYVGIGYRGNRWLWDATFGSYYPEQLGIPAHDTPTHRGVLKCAYSITPNFQIYAVGILENNRPADGVVGNNKQNAILSGVQLTF
jgi:hypothetical protein